MQENIDENLTDGAMEMTARWTPYREPIRVTLLRTGAIAVVIGALIARPWAAAARWPVATLLALWPALGGHFVELWFLNWLRPRISNARAVQVGARMLVWFVGGMLLALAMSLTARAIGAGAAVRGAWWVWGLAFIGIEVLVHLVLLLWGRPSFFNGRG